MQNIRSLEAGALNREFRRRCLKWEIRKMMLRNPNRKVGVPRDKSESWCYCSERGIKAWSEGCDWPHPANGPTALNVWKLSANRREKVLSRRNKGLDTFLPPCADFQDDNYWSFRDSGPNNRSNTFYLSHPMPTIWNQLAAQTKLKVWFWSVLAAVCRLRRVADWRSAKPSVLPRTRYIFSHFRRFLRACFLTKPHNLSSPSWVWNTFAFKFETVYQTQKTLGLWLIKIFVPVEAQRNTLSLKGYDCITKVGMCHIWSGLKPPHQWYPLIYQWYPK